MTPGPDQAQDDSGARAGSSGAPACRVARKGSDMASEPCPWWIKVGQLVVSAVNALAQLLDAIHYLK